MDFLYYYNWLRFSILTPSYFAKNRLLIERTFQNRLIFSFFGFTQKSFMWSQVSSTVLNSYLWKNIYYCFIIIFIIIFIIVLLSFNFFIFNFPIKYWIIYISWRIFDGFYFFFLQCQYLFIICLLSSSWYVLNTYFNIQLNLLYLIIFNYFNINTDIQVTNIYTKNYTISYFESLQNLFKHSAVFNMNLLTVSYYFYNIKLYLNTFSPYILFLSNKNYFTYWSNFINYNKSDNYWSADSHFYLSNLIIYKWFIYLNTNAYEFNSIDMINYSKFLLNWFNILKVWRWNLINLNASITSITELKSLVNNNYLSIDSVINFNSWVVSLEWILYRWINSIQFNSIKNIYQPSIIILNNTENSQGIYYLISIFIKNIFFNRNNSLQNYTTTTFNSTTLLLNFDIYNLTNSLSFFSYITYYWYYYWLSNTSILHYTWLNSINYTFDYKHQLTGISTGWSFFI